MQALTCRLSSSIARFREPMPCRSRNGRVAVPHFSCRHVLAFVTRGRSPCHAGLEPSIRERFFPPRHPSSRGSGWQLQGSNEREQADNTKNCRHASPSTIIGPVVNDFPVRWKASFVVGIADNAESSNVGVPRRGIDYGLRVLPSRLQTRAAFSNPLSMDGTAGTPTVSGPFRSMDVARRRRQQAMPA